MRQWEGGAVEERRVVANAGMGTADRLMGGHGETRLIPAP